jgi:hypothetical protein
MAKETLIDLKDLLNAIDRKDKLFYRKLTPEQKKEFSPWLTMRWATSCELNEYNEYFVPLVNAVVNKNFSDLKNHPELTWMTIAICGERNTRRRFMKPPKGKKKNKLQEFVSDLYPQMKLDDIDAFIAVNTPDDLKTLARTYGYDEETIKVIFK